MWVYKGMKISNSKFAKVCLYHKCKQVIKQMYLYVCA